MPVDTRRINGPEDTTCPNVYEKSCVEIEFVNRKGLRSDGRAPDKVRPLFLKVGVVSQARGSAYIEMEKTKVICSVYGPRQVRQDDFSLTGQIACEFKFATFSCCKRRQHQHDTQEKDYAVLIQQSLEPALCLDKFPKAQLNVFVTVLENDGSALSAAITAASLAIADAGIDMYDVVVACSAGGQHACVQQQVCVTDAGTYMYDEVVACSVRHHGSTLLLDPSSHEEYENRTSMGSNPAIPNGEVTVGLMPNLHQVTALTQEGELSAQTLTESIKTCVEYCQKIYPVLQQCLVSSIKNKFSRDS